LFIAVSAQVQQLTLNGTSLSGQLSSFDKVISYSVNIPAGPDGEAISFYVAMSAKSNCTVNSTTNFPNGGNIIILREFPGVSSLYYLLDDTDKSNVGTFTIDLLLANKSLACEYTIWAVQVPTQTFSFGESYEYTLVPDTGVHYTLGDGTASESAFIVNVSVPLGAPFGCNTQVWVDDQNSEGGEGEFSFISPGGYLLFNFVGITAGTSIWGSDDSASGFYPPIATPLEVTLKASFNDSYPCTFLFTVEQLLPQQISVGQSPMPITGNDGFNSVSIFEISAPSQPYQVQITYVSGYCEGVSWAANGASWNGGDFQLIGYEHQMNVTNPVATVSAPASSETVIWAVRSGFDSCALTISTN